MIIAAFGERNSNGRYSHEYILLDLQRRGIPFSLGGGQPAVGRYPYRTGYVGNGREGSEGGGFVSNFSRDSCLFSRDERELLTLPPIFPYPLFVGKEGLPQNNSFRLKVNFQKADGTYFMNPEVIGSYIDIRPGCCYMCSEAQYAILKSASSCNAEIGRLKEREKILACSLRYVALIKENAKKIDARLDPFLEKIDVVAPDYLSISVKEDTDGTYYASPIILNADGSPYGEKDAREFGRKFKTGAKRSGRTWGKIVPITYLIRSSKMDCSRSRRHGN